MADNHGGGVRGYPPPRDVRDAQLAESDYPPPPGEEEETRSAVHHVPPMARGPVTLPSIANAYAAYPPQPPVRGYAPVNDPRVAAYSQSPSNTNGYNPPPAYLPPVQPGGDPRQHQYPEYFAQQQQQRPPYDQYAYNRYPPQGGPPVGYPGYDYQRGGAGVPGPPQAQAAPRQRTSIACRYCRKRKIRCSGYQHTTNGKCTNCDKLRIDCVFQPVSSNSSTAFVPVSALPGGVPPGTQLYGAYGQPLSQGQPGGQPGHPPPSRGGPFPNSPVDYPMASPTNSQYPAGPLNERGEPAGRRRSRPPEEDHPLRLPPPQPYGDDDNRRRSPASNASTGTPPTTFSSYPPETPYNGETAQQAPRSASGGPAVAQANATTNPMRLDNLIGSESRSHSDIDSNMLGRLNRRA